MDFGTQLRYFRLQTINSETKKPLTQQKLGELVGQKLGDRGFTGAAISDWERAQSTIHANNRLILLCLVHILKEYGGIKNINDANTLLEAGNYRALDQQESEKIFSLNFVNKTATHKMGDSEFKLFGAINLVTELKQLHEKAKAGPSPYWPRLAVALLNHYMNTISALQVLRGILWVWIGLIAYYLIIPSLKWNSVNSENIFLYMGLYVAGALILPLLIGAMTTTKNSVFWTENKMQNSIILRLYIYQGAYIGFHVGYFLVIPLSLLQAQLKLGTPYLLEALIIMFLLLVSFACAHLIPHNLWLAYKRLDIKDGGIFFVFVILAPFWAWFFHEFHHTFISPLIGFVMFLISFTIFLLAQTMSQRKKRTS